MKSPSPASIPAARFPLLTALLGGVALVAWTIPGVNEALQFDRTTLAHGELWRLLTGHLTHWTTSHLGWDLAVFVLLGTFVEQRSRTLLLTTLTASALVISIAVWLLEPELSTYRGLSGVDSALFAAVGVRLSADALARRAWHTVLLAAAACGGFVVKSGVELASSSTIFVAADASFTPVPLAHLSGALAGAVSALALAAWRAPHSSSANAAQVVAAWPCGSPTGRRRSM